MLDDFRLFLITGPARSGKSELAEELAKSLPQQIIYVATAKEDPSDLEWQARINNHRLRRPEDWITREVTEDLSHIIREADSSTCLLIDSLGTWVANWLETEDRHWQAIQTDLLTALVQSDCLIILVAEETGWGLVPAYPIGRQFRDRLGNLVREVGAISDAFYLVIGGYGLNLKQLGTKSFLS